MQTNFGLPDKIIDELVAKLEVVVANTYILYIKSLNYHWNLEDPRFAMLHELFEKHYDTLAEFGDLYAERIRSMGRHAPATMAEFLELTTLKEGRKGITGDEMIDDLAASHEQVCQELRELIDLSTEKGDPGTADILTDGLREHEKAAWFLRSHL